ncbi:MAG: stage II sporulation protein D [Oscillospiraceae bacterium]|nr:stage II sporulation protein D [Oscillospiraceae bacterium]
MKAIMKQFVQSAVMTVVLPGMLFSSSEKLPQTDQLEAVVCQHTWIPVLKEDGRIVAMELEEYISRVVLGEMPASFDEEALKSQAVAARTYTLQMVEEGSRHQGAVCTDYRCCQSYMDPEEYLHTRGTQEHLDKVFEAVADTAGEVVCYDGELICATYFASAGGYTEDAREVWGQSYPYLISVSSPESSVYDDKEVRFSFQEFQDRLGTALKGAPESWFGAVTYTVGGGVDSMRIGQTRYSGVEIRGIFGLRSTVFQVEVTEDSVVFRTDGYGHRVGLSQYGAEAMAVDGYSYDQILSHYYQGTTLETYRDD